MKRFIIILFAISLYILQFAPPIYISATSRYARIENNTNIYKSLSSQESISNIFCIAERSYFVEIIGDYNEYFRVNYNGISGFVKKNDVKEVSTTPSTPFPYNIKLTIGSNCNLRSTPTTKSPTTNIITTLHVGEDDFQFIGRISSEESIDFGGTTWYYVNYQGTYGYIYNQYIKSITHIYENTEPYSYLSTPIERISNPITHTPSLILIIVLLIPIILLLIILYLPKKFPSTTKSKKPPKARDKY